jgi:hypothetical protein
MGINFDNFWILGSVRIRASAPDPFAGLRGRAYIAARKLDQRRIERFDAKSTAETKSEFRKNLMNAVNRYPAVRIGGNTYWLASGSLDFLPNPARRYYLLPELTAEEE